MDSETMLSSLDRRCLSGGRGGGFDREEAPEGADELNRRGGQRDSRNSIVMDNKI